MWQRNRLFPPRGPIVIYAPENDPLPTWNIKNHARTWKFRKKDDGDDGDGDSEKDLAQFAPRRRKRSAARAGGDRVEASPVAEANCNLVVNWIYGEKKKRKREKEKQQFIVSQFLIH